MIAKVPNDRIRRPSRGIGNGSGAHNRSTATNSALGAKGGQAQVPKGFATLEDAERKAVAAQGGKARQAKAKAKAKHVR